MSNLTFKDVNESDWARKYIYFLANHQNEIVSGYPDGRFGPGDPVTIGQFCAMAVMAANIRSVIDDTGTYDTWARKFVNYVGIERGILFIPPFSGRPTHIPELSISDIETAIERQFAFNIAWHMVGADILPHHSGAADFFNERINRFRDNAGIWNEAREGVAQLVLNNAVSGHSDRILAPKDTLTRAQACSVLTKCLASEDDYFVKSGPVNVRESPSASGSVLGTFAVNQIVKVVLPIETGISGTEWWIKVCYNGTTGWAAGRFLDKVLDAVPGPDENVYAIASTDLTRLSQEQQRANAEYIYRYLRSRGWTKVSICGLLGNIQQESWFNPGVWQNEDTSTGGYGIIQWTPNRKFLNWAGLAEGTANEMATNNPKRLMDLQLEYLIHSCQQGTQSEWFATRVVTDKNLHSPNTDPRRYYSPIRITTGVQAYINRTSSTEEEMAYIFHAHYVRSGDSLDTIEKNRAIPARAWYERLENLP